MYLQEMRDGQRERERKKEKERGGPEGGGGERGRGGEGERERGGREYVCAQGIEGELVTQREKRWVIRAT